MEKISAYGSRCYSEWLPGLDLRPSPTERKTMGADLCLSRTGSKRRKEETKTTIVTWPLGLIVSTCPE